MSTTPSSSANQNRPKIGGWLLVLAISLCLLAPLWGLGTAMNAIDIFLSTSRPPLGLLSISPLGSILAPRSLMICGIVVIIGLVALPIASLVAGILLLFKKKTGVRLAKIYLLSSVVLSLLAAIINVRFFGYALVTVMVLMPWLRYLANSDRVKETFRI